MWWTKQKNSRRQTNQKVLPPSYRPPTGTGNMAASLRFSVVNLILIQCTCSRNISNFVPWKAKYLKTLTPDIKESQTLQSQRSIYQKQDSKLHLDTTLHSLYGFFVNTYCRFCNSDFLQLFNLVLHYGHKN